MRGFLSNGHWNGVRMIGRHSGLGPWKVNRIGIGGSPDEQYIRITPDVHRINLDRAAKRDVEKGDFLALGHWIGQQMIERLNAPVELKLGCVIGISRDIEIVDDQLIMLIGVAAEPRSTQAREAQG